MDEDTTRTDRGAGTPYFPRWDEIAPPVTGVRDNPLLAAFFESLLRNILRRLSRSEVLAVSIAGDTVFRLLDHRHPVQRSHDVLNMRVADLVEGQDPRWMPVSGFRRILEQAFTDIPDVTASLDWNMATMPLMVLSALITAGRFYRQCGAAVGADIGVMDLPVDQTELRRSCFEKVTLSRDIVSAVSAQVSLKFRTESDRFGAGKSPMLILTANSNEAVMAEWVTACGVVVRREPFLELIVRVAGPVLAMVAGELHTRLALKKDCEKMGRLILDKCDSHLVEACRTAMVQKRNTAVR
ncbi:MAG: hypothetical protein C0404_05935, partial [Verrucomicrobia bacterium]|nr:hypothetical protein [Verrucomicrobiota bacterium]